MSADKIVITKIKHIIPMNPMTAINDAISANHARMSERYGKIKVGQFHFLISSYPAYQAADIAGRLVNGFAFLLNHSRAAIHSASAYS